MNTQDHDVNQTVRQFFNRTCRKQQHHLKGCDDRKEHGHELTAYKIAQLSREELEGEAGGEVTMSLDLSFPPNC